MIGEPPKPLFNTMRIKKGPNLDQFRKSIQSVQHYADPRDQVYQDKINSKPGEEPAVLREDWDPRDQDYQDLINSGGLKSAKADKE